MTLANELQLKIVMESNVEIEAEGMSTIPSSKTNTQPEKEESNKGPHVYRTVLVYLIPAWLVPNSIPRRK